MNETQYVKIDNNDVSPALIKHSSLKDVTLDFSNPSSTTYHRRHEKPKWPW